MENSTLRLNKYLANNGICSRRNVTYFLKNNNITVNGKKVYEPGVRINPILDSILVNRNKIKKPTYVYYVINKKKGVVSTTSDEFGRQNVTSFIRTKERIYPVGRLDKDTSGILLLTNDGELTNQLTHPKYHVNKVYQLTIQGQISSMQLNMLRNGVLLEDGITAPAKIFIIKTTSTLSFLEFTIHEGRNRQIRRMCEKVGIQLLELKRVTFGPITLGKLKEGQYRELTQNELRLLKK